MTDTLLDPVARVRSGSGTALFLRRWLANPLRMGSVIPSSPALRQRLVRCGWPPTGGVVLELGAGTGVISRAFLDAGLPPERLVTVEVDRALADRLRDTLDRVTVLHGDARALPDRRCRRAGMDSPRTVRRGRRSTFPPPACGATRQAPEAFPRGVARAGDGGGDRTRKARGTLSPCTPCERLSLWNPSVGFDQGGAQPTRTLQPAQHAPP